MQNLYSIKPVTPDFVLEKSIDYLSANKKIHPAYVYKVTIQFGYLLFKEPLEGDIANIFLDQSREKYLWDYDGWISDITISSVEPFLKTYTMLQTLKDLFTSSQISTSVVTVEVSSPINIMVDNDLTLGRSIKYTISYNDGAFSFQYI